MTTLSADLPSYADLGWHHLTSPDEMEQAISDALDQGDPNTPGWIRFDRDVVTSEPGEYQLRVAAAPTSGYAALLWFRNVDPAEHPHDPLAQRLWVTFNSAPPLEDPHLASDYDTDRYHDRFTAIPIEQAHRALREFCHTGGGRPTSVSWVAGDYYGRITERLTVAAGAA
ncbi:Imm1 family immunity protein [Actinopolyspora halophila]|uniref:Imm1 family immunity protein n=1 Tax=Actinopolyspora halophila TaxID=1850 RepID=UPI000380E8C6|nr:Imm1 family immunity protein [Actinopolyspora halophila]